MAINRRARRRRNPFATANTLDSVTFTIGVEGSNAIAVAIQCKDVNGNDVSQRVAFPFWLSTDANGDNPATQIVGPNGGYAVGTDGTLLGRVNGDGLMAIGTLVIDATAEKFKTTTTATFTIGGWQTTKAAQTAITFTAAHVVSASKFGVILIQVNSAGTVSTKVPSATQAYTSAALAFAALPAPDAGSVALGYIAIAAGVAAWTANTDDMTNASDLTTATFVDAPLNAILTPRRVTLLSEADGDVDITISETRIRTFYPNAEMPDGTVVTGSAITFA